MEHVTCVEVLLFEIFVDASLMRSLDHHPNRFVMMHFQISAGLASLSKRLSITRTCYRNIVFLPI